jgi:putative oxidoreductase
MKNILPQLPAIVLGLAFVVFGGMYFVMQPQSDPNMSDAAKQYFDVMAVKTKYMVVVKICELLFGLLILIPKTRALGLILIAPICVNILFFDLLVNGKPQMGILLVLVNFAALWLNKAKYKSIWS